MKNHVQSGKSITIPAPAGGTVSGRGVMVGHLFGIAACTAAEGEPVAIYTSDVYDIDKETGTALTFGAPVYFDPSTNKVQPAADGLKRIGVAIAAAGNAATTARVLLDGAAS